MTMNDMTLSKLIEKLAQLKTEHGDLPVRVASLSHLWDPEPIVKTTGTQKWVLLNG